MKKQDKTDNNKKKVLQHLQDAYGIVTTACNNAGVARSQFYKWLEEDDKFRLQVEDVQEEAIDYVESKLFEKVSGVTVKKGETDDGEDIVYNVPPSDTAIIFYLKTKAKKRGYVERTETVFKNEDVDFTF